MDARNEDIINDADKIAIARRSNEQVYALEMKGEADKIDAFRRKFEQEEEDKKAKNKASSATGDADAGDGEPKFMHKIERLNHEN